MKTLKYKKIIKIIPKLLFSLLILSIFLSNFQEANALAVSKGDGAILYAPSSNTTPQIQRYTNSTNDFNGNVSTVAGTQAAMTVYKTSPTKQEAIGAYQDTSGNLQVMCFNGTTWTNEWSIAVAASGTPTTRRFDIAFETNTGDVTVAYSRNTAATNALAYRTKAGSSGCGTANWAAATNFPTGTVVTSGTVMWVKANRNGISSSNLSAWLWGDNAATPDLGAAIWDGSAFTNFKVLETSMEFVTAAGDTDNFDVGYESTSGDVMTVWGNSLGANGTNGSRYMTCTGGTSSCTWGTATAIPIVLDDVTNLDLSSDPLTDRMAFAGIGNAGSDLSAAYWSGSAWTGYANVDITCETPTAGTKMVTTGWLNNNGNKKWYISYDDSSGTGISYKYAIDGGTITSPTDYTSSPALNNLRARYDTDVNPFYPSELLQTLSDSTNGIFAYRLTMDTAGNLSWSNMASAVSLGTKPSTPQQGFSYQYWRFSNDCASVTGAVNWNAGASWVNCTGAGGIPSSSDTVHISSGSTVTANSVSGTAAASIVMDRPETANSLIITDGQTLTISGALTFAPNATVNAQTVTLGTSSGAANLTVGSISIPATIGATGTSKIGCAASNTGTLTVSGSGTTAITGSSVTSAGASSIDMSNGSCSVTTGTGATTLTGGSLSAALLKVGNTGTLTINGNLTFAGIIAGAQLTTVNTAGVTINNSTVGASGNVTIASGSTVVFTNTNTINGGYTWGGAVAINSGTTTLGATTTFTGNLTIADSATLTLGNFAFTASGSTTIGNGSSGTLNGASGSTGTYTFNGDITVNAGAFFTLCCIGTHAVSLGGNISNSGSFGTGTGAVTFTASKALSGASDMTFGGAVTINTGITITNNNTGTVLVSGALTFTGNWTQGANSTLNMASTNSGAGILNASTNTPNTVTYSGIGTIKAPSVSYYNLVSTGTVTGIACTITNNLTVSAGTLTLSNTTATTVSGTTTVSGGTLDVTGSTSAKKFTGLVSVSSGTFSGSSSTIQMEGGLTQTGGIVSITGTLTFQTTAAQGLTGLISATSIANITISSGVTLTNNGPVSMTGILTLTGNWTQGSGSTLSMSNASPFSGAGTFTASTSTNTVSYTGGSNQTGKVTTYDILALGSTSVKTFATTPTVNNQLRISSGATIVVTTGVVTYGPAGALVYSSSVTARTVTSEEWVTPFTGTGGVAINSTTGTLTLDTAKVFDTSVPLRIGTGATLATGNFQVTLGGDLIITQFGVSGSGTLTAGSSPIVITGTATTQSIDGFTTTGAISMTKTAGVATFLEGVSGAGLTINGSGGTLDLGVSLTHNFSGDVTLTAGTLNGGSSTLNENNSSATAWNGTGSLFTAGTGTVVFNSSGDQTHSASATTFNNLALAGAGSTKNLTNVSTINGTFLVDIGVGFTSATNLVVGGVTTVGAGAIFTQSSTLNFTTGGLTVNSTGIYTNTGTGDLILGGNVSNAGTITLNSSGSVDSCTDVTNDIVITSTSGGATRTWSGAGTFTIQNVSVTDQAASGIIISAYYSTSNSSNSGWLFTTCSTYNQSDYRLFNASTPGDGTTWTPRTSASVRNWFGITYGNGLFVAVAYNGTTANDIMTSPDGITWTSRTSPAANQWMSVTYGNGLFVAVAQNGTTANDIMTSPDGITWTSRTSPVANQWQSVTYGNNLFVAVSSNGTTANDIMTSPDGIIWTSRTSPTANNWYAVTYGNGLFVAVSGGGTTADDVMRSSDGITWTSASLTGVPSAYTWAGATYGNGLFVAFAVTAASNNIMTSPDGITWTARTNPFVTSGWSNVTYGNGKFVGVSGDANSNTNAITSSDGITWNSVDTGIFDGWADITFGNGQFIAVGQFSTGEIMSSGTDFGTALATQNTAGTLTTTGDTFRIRQLLAVTTSQASLSQQKFKLQYALKSGTCDTSFTGETYADITNSTPISYSTAFNERDGVLIASNASDPTGGRTIVNQSYEARDLFTNGIAAIPSGQDGMWDFELKDNGAPSSTSYCIRAVKTVPSTSASTWTSRTSAVDNDWQAITYGNGLFVALSTSGTGNRVMTSPDGITWTSRTSAADNGWVSITYGNGLFVAVAYNSVMTSPDGITWTSRTSAAANSWQGVTYGNGLFVAVSGDGAGNRVMTSPDGITWTIRTSAVNNAWIGVTYGNGLFVAVAYSGTGNRVMTSPDGITWTSRTSAADNSWYGVTYGNGLFVAVAATGTGNRVMTSPDGITWTSRTSAADNSWQNVTYGNGLFVAVSPDGTGNRVMTSPDGITWTSRTSAVDNNWYAVTYGNGLFVAVAYTGTGNRVMTAPTTDTLLDTYTQIPEIITAPPFTVTQYAYGWRSDDGTESGASYLVDQNTPLTSDVYVNTIRRLRLLISNTGGNSAPSLTYRLEYSSGACSAWAQVPASGDNSGTWVMASSSFLTNASATTDSTGLRNPAGKTFLASYAMTTANQAAALTLSSSQFTELEYSVAPTTNVVTGTVYCFRLSHAGVSAGFTYSVVPQIVAQSFLFRSRGGGVNVESSGTPDAQAGGGGGGGSGGSGGSTTAAGTAVLTSNAVSSVTIDSGGSGYGATPPTVSFCGGGGTGASGTAVLTTGSVTSVTINSGGSGYTTAPTVVFGGACGGTGGGAGGGDSGFIYRFSHLAYSPIPGINIFSIFRSLFGFLI